MSHLLANVYPHDVVAILAVYAVESRIHLFLSTEGFDDAQSTKRLFHLAHGVAP